MLSVNAVRDPLSNQRAEKSVLILPPLRGFRMASLNINQLTTHIDELRILLANNDIDIVSINETKLNESIRDHDVHIPGYEIIRRDRLTKCGGGVCFYVKKFNQFYSTK